MANQSFLDLYGSVDLEEFIDKIRLYSIQKLSQEDLDKWTSEKITMRANISLLEKQQIMIEASLLLFKMDISIEYSIIEAEKFKFFNVLMGCYTNITWPKEKEKELCTIKNYDLIAPLVKPWVLKACEFDYKDTCALIDQTFDWHRLQDLINMIEGLDFNKLSEVTKENQSFMESLETPEGKEKMSQLLEIARFGDPTTTKVVEALKIDSALMARNSANIKNNKKKKSS